MSKPVSINGLVLHFRTPETTLACLQSLADEGIRNVVLVDNSEDSGRSIGLMEQGLSSLKEAGVRISVLSPPNNLGFAGGVARGLKHILSSERGHVLLLNSDAKLCSDSVSLMISELKYSPFVIPMVCAESRQMPASLFAYYHPLLALILRRHWPGSSRHPSGCCLMIREDAVRSDLFDQDFFFYGEDAMLGFILERQKIEVREARSALIVHAGSMSSKNGSIFYEYHLNRSHWLLARKTARNSTQYLVYICARCLTLPLRALVRCIRLRSIVPIIGLIYATSDVISGRFRKFIPPLK